MSKNSGWVKLHRKFTSHWLYMKDGNPFTFREAWIDILLNVNYKTEKFNIGFNLVTCNPGESLKSIKTWAKRWKWSESKVRRFFKLLESDDMITTEGISGKSTRLTVCNWETYQPERRTDEEQVKNSRRASGEQVATNKKIKKEKKIKKKEKDTAPKSGAKWQEATPMNLKQFVEWCRISTQPHVQIIGEWADQMNKSFDFSGYDTHGEWKRLFFKQNLRAARDLEPSWKQDNGRRRMSEATAMLVSESKLNGFKTGNLSTLIKYMSKV